MANTNASGQVQSLEQIRAERFRRGQCETCFDDPVQLFAIKKRIGGLIRDRVPLTEEGKVYNGTCLGCHPDKDPRSMIRRARTDDGRHHRRRHHRDYDRERDRHHHRDQQQSSHAKNNHRGQRLPPQTAYSMDMNADSQFDSDLERHSSVPNVRMGGRGSLQKQEGYIDISRSIREEDERISQSMPGRFNNEDSAAHLDFADELENEMEQDEPGYVEEITYNIFNEPVIVRKPKHRSQQYSSRSKNNSNRLNDANNRSPHPSSPLESPGGSSFRHELSRSHSSPRQPHGYNNIRPPPFEEKVEEDNAPDSNNFEYAKPPPETNGRDAYGNRDNGLYRQDSGPPPPFKQSSSRRGFTMEESQMPNVPDLAPVSDADNQSKSSGDNGELDALAQLIAQHCAARDETVLFDPGSKTVFPNAELHLEEYADDKTVMSTITMDTYWQGRETVGTMATRQKSLKTNLSAISEAPSTASSMQPSLASRQTSLASHRIVEPAVPAQDAAPAQYEPTAPNLVAVRELVGMCTQAGEDEEAINTVTQALVVDNATSMSKDLALFCLTQLWVLARKSDENKRRIIFEDATCERLSVTFEVIIEAMRIYCDSSAVIQTRACGVLWSLSMASNDRKHVAQGGGCEAILNAMLAHMEDDALQVMALGALKVLSFDNIGKSMLRAFGALTIISQVMRLHVENPSIQTEGCVILGNLAVDEASQKVTPVTENEIEAIIMAMLAHEDSLDVHEAACFTLMSLASSSDNVETIQSNTMSKEALELAFRKHPDDVGINILTLLRRLKFDAPTNIGGKLPFEEANA